MRSTTIGWLQAIRDGTRAGSNKAPARRSNARGIASRLAGGLLAERGLRSRKARDRHAERRAGHVVEPRLVAERHRGGIAAVLTADADLQLLSDFSAALDADLDQFTDAFLVDRDEWIGRQDAALGVDAEE